MTPAARVQAAIEVLDQVLAGAPAEQALTGWARRSRFAGSKDRAAVRDHVFDGLRRLRSAAARGGAMTGRGVMLGLLREAGDDAEPLFDGSRHGPVRLTDKERHSGRVPEPGAEALDLPDWLWPGFRAGLGAAAEAEAEALRHRAPVHLRVNAARMGREAAAEMLEGEGIATRPHPAASTALEVIEGTRRIRQSAAYSEGVVELQDAASQAAVEALPLSDGMRVLDYCAGGGGKSLAMAARARLALFAHDAAPERMADLPARAARAGARVVQLSGMDLGRSAPFDLVLCDAPCSGSGAWRRAPHGKWTLTEAGLVRLRETQAAILDRAAGLVAPGGTLAYATCSLLEAENGCQVAAFMARWPGWSELTRRAWRVSEGTDGFFLSVLTRALAG